uniref:Putative 3-beta-hydroxysteroid-Delta(8),Delta(7)-isomerase n=1 Tax=Populus alba TaxID=43335 RepID=A0A4U5NLS0_POPAL|nr:putative 3-beta-hydroxysteroid-Delta(8),Delta(7)-isomerase [Populus alba]
MEGQPHPYAPTDLKLPGYVPNFFTQFTIVSVYGLSSLLVVSLIWILSGRSRKLDKIDRLLMCWWAHWYAIASGKSYSYILQFSVSLGQLYGTAVYFLTAYLEGDHFAASSYHYYVYYIGANASWVVIPSLIAVRCWNKICSAVQVQGQKRTKSH